MASTLTCKLRPQIWKSQRSTKKRGGGYPLTSLTLVLNQINISLNGEESEGIVSKIWLFADETYQLAPAVSVPDSMGADIRYGGNILLDIGRNYFSSFSSKRRHTKSLWLLLTAAFVLIISSHYFGHKIFPSVVSADLEFVKSITRVRFQNFSISPEKTRKLQ